MKYGLINYIYEISYRNRCKKRIGSNCIYHLLGKIYDPIIKAKINNQDCYIRFSHQGVYYMNVYPDYDKNIGKICSYIKKVYHRPLIIADVGANVGDTILSIGDKENFYYAIEGEDRYASLLSKNLIGYNFSLISAYCGDSDTEDTYSVKYFNGTGRLISDKDGGTHKISKFDTVIKDYDIKLDFIKIDTDGFDFSVIRGMKETLNNFPILYFEWTAKELLANNEDLLSVYSTLMLYDYKTILIFDKYGSFMCSTIISNLKLLDQLIHYSLDADIYFDVCVFHKDIAFDVDEMIKCLWRK